MICLAFKEIGYMCVDYPFVLIVHGFEGFGGNAIKARCFPLLEFGYGPSDFGEGDWGVNFGETWLLGNEFENGVINWSVSVENFVKVHAEYGHVFFCIGGEVTIVKFHGHIGVGLVVCGFATNE